MYLERLAANIVNTTLSRLAISLRVQAKQNLAWELMLDREEYCKFRLLGDQSETLDYIDIVSKKELLGYLKSKFGNADMNTDVVISGYGDNLVSMSAKDIEYWSSAITGGRPKGLGNGVPEDFDQYIKDAWRIALHNLDRSPLINKFEKLYKAKSNGKKSLTIYHETSPRSAVSIVQNGFNTDIARLGQDKCANFYILSLGENAPTQSGCTMSFEWSGSVKNCRETDVNLLEKNVLHIQSSWRAILTSGTGNYLTLLQCIFNDEDEAEVIKCNKIVSNHFGKNIEVK